METTTTTPIVTSPQVKPIYLIDASLLKESDCLRKVNFIHNEGLTTSLSNFKMDYGTAFHKFAHRYVSGDPISDSLQEGAQFYLSKCLNVPEDDFRTIDHLMMTMQAYVKGPYAREIDLLKPKFINGKPCLEMQFEFPYLSTPSYDVMLTGTCDMIGVYLDREVINDYKVTAVWKKDDYLASYDLDPQLIFYSWVLKRYGITDTYLPGMITGVFIKSPTQTTKGPNGKRVAVNGWNGATFQRSLLIEFSTEQIKEFEVWLKDKINQIIRSHEAKEWPPNFNCCNDTYGPCQFCPMCKDYNPETRELKRRSMYSYRKYDPSQFQK